jgi:hypothetical protein
VRPVIGGALLTFDSSDRLRVDRGRHEKRLRNRSRRALALPLAEQKRRLAPTNAVHRFGVLDSLEEARMKLWLNVTESAEYPGVCRDSCLC